MENEVGELNALLDRLDAGTEYGHCEDKEHVCEHGDPLELFRRIFLLHDYESQGNRKIGTVSCGSFKADTSRGLYRLLYLTLPKRLDFSDMYKSGSLVTLRSPDWRFVADAKFFKYELGVYLSAAKECVGGSRHGVIGGWPGADNGVRMKDPELAAWAALLERCLAREWDVYPGNNFKV